MQRSLYTGLPVNLCFPSEVAVTEYQLGSFLETKSVPQLVWIKPKFENTLSIDAELDGIFTATLRKSSFTVRDL